MTTSDHYADDPLRDLTNLLASHFPEGDIHDAAIIHKIAENVALSLFSNGHVDIVNACGGTDDRYLLEAPSGELRHVRIRLRLGIGSLLSFLAAAYSIEASGTNVAGRISGYLWALSAVLLATGIKLSRLSDLHAEVCRDLSVDGPMTLGSLHRTLSKYPRESIMFAIHDLRQSGIIQYNDQTGTITLLESIVEIAF